MQVSRPSVSVFGRGGAPRAPVPVPVPVPVPMPVPVPSRRARPRSPGYAALGTVALLCLASALSLSAVDRLVVTHQRAQGHALRHAAAFEAAEAGLDWAMSRLADPMAIDAACNDVVASPGSRSFLRTYLDVVPASRAVTPVPGHDAGGAPLALQPTCTRDPSAGLGTGWHCRCPSDGHPGMAPTPSADGALHPSFRVHFDAASAPGSLTIVATGCTQLGGACGPSTGDADAVAQVSAVHAFLPALVTLPSAALTALGDVRSAAALVVSNADVGSGGTVVQSGATVELSGSILAGPAGSPADMVVQSNDRGLSALSGPQLFRRLTALDPADWQRSTAVQRVDCSAPSAARTTCASALAAAASQVPEPAVLWVDGDAVVVGPLVLGSAARPVLLVVAGRLTLEGAVQIAGLVEARSVVWNHAGAAGGDGGVSGALVSEGTYGGAGSPRIAYDRSVLDRLRAGGEPVRVPGGWRDF